MNKKQQADMQVLNELLDRINEAITDNKNYYLRAGWRQELSKLNTACARAVISIHEDTEWTKYGCSVIGREVALAELPKLAEEVKKMLGEILTKKVVKKQYANTEAGAVSYAKSAIKQWGARNGNESHRDAADRMERVSPIAL